MQPHKGQYTCTYRASHIHMWYPSRHKCTPSMLHCVMESETPCAGLFLAVNARSDSSDKSNLWDSRHLTVRPSRSEPLAEGSAVRCVVNACVSVWDRNDRPSTSQLSIYICWISSLSCWNFIIDHMCWMFTRLESLIKTQLIFNQNCLHGVICLLSQVQLLDNSYELISGQEWGACCVCLASDGWEPTSNSWLYLK